MLLRKASISAAPALSVLAAAVAGRLTTAYQAVYNGSGAAHAFVHFKRTKGAIEGARPTFHAPVFFQNDSLFIFQGKNAVRAYLDAHSAADASTAGKFKTRRV
jgi:hypothetical protein